MHIVGWLMMLTGLIAGIIHSICCIRMEARGYSLDWLHCLCRGHDWNIDHPDLDMCQRCGKVEDKVSIADI